MQAYVLNVIALKANELIVKACSADGVDRSTARPFSAAEFAPGRYLVEGPARKCPPRPMSLAELAEWFDKLHGSWGKEIGKGMERYRVQRLDWPSHPLA